MGWTFSWEEFKSFVNDFIDVSEEICDGWAWQGEKNCPGGAFIFKKLRRELTEDIPLPHHDHVEPVEDNPLQFEDTGTVQQAESQGQETTWEYHVLYSLSYSSPVLYFNAFTPDGRLLPLDVIWQGGTGAAQEALQEMRWEALSQQEHPILRRPFFQLHPCKTAEFLGVHQRTSHNPVVTWLSSIGPAVGLHLSHKYGSLVTIPKD